MRNRIQMMVLAFAGTAILFSGCKSPEEKMIGHYEEMTEIIKEADEPAEGLEDLHDYVLSNGAAIGKLKHDLRAELSGIEDKGDRADRWEEHAEALKDAVKDFNDEAKDFVKDVADDDDARDWCKEYNKGWEKIDDTWGEDMKSMEKYAHAGGVLPINCPEEEVAGGGGGGGGGGNYGPGGGGPGGGAPPSMVK